MSGIEFDEWMSDSDALLWNIERDPLLRSTVASVWLLDSVPDRDHMDATVDNMINQIPRLRQRVIDDRNGIATPSWADDPHFDRSYHYRWVRLPGATPGLADLSDHAQHLAGRAFDRDRPLWEIDVIEGLSDGRGAFVMSIHHAIADGLGMVNILTHLVDLGPDDDHARVEVPAVPATPATPSAPPAGVGRSLRRRLQTEAETGVRLGRASIKLATDLVRDPMGTARNAIRTGTSVANVVTPATTPLSPVMTGRSMSPTFATFRFGLDDVKASARTVGGTINDVFVAAVLDGLDRYHEQCGVDCEEIRMAMPISVRTDDTADQMSNQFVPTRIVLPLQASSPAERLAATRDRLAAERAEPALHHMNDISAAIGRLGPAASVGVIGSMMKGVDITTSNVPGPPFPVWISGAKVEEFYAHGPLAGAAVNITLFSYDGTLHFGVTADPAAIDDIDAFVACIREGFEAALALGED